MTLPAPTVPIFEGQDFYVPHFEMKVGDRPLQRDAIHDITSVTYHDSLDKIDGFDIAINNWDAEAKSFKYAESPLFDPGRKLELWMGYFGRDRLKLMVTGQITSLKPTFPASGQPTLVISGLNLLHSLRRSQRSEPYENKTDSDIARAIVARLRDKDGLDLDLKTPDAASERPYPYLFQDNRYDIVFLMERARRVGYDLFIIEPVDSGIPTLFFGRSPRVRQVTYDLAYGRSLIQFQPTFRTALQVGKVTVRGWNAVTKEVISETVDRSQLATTHVARGQDEDPAGAFSNREEVITDRPVASKEEARTLARETLERIAKETITGSASVVGLPDLRAGTVINLDGVGRRFGGRFFVTKTSHTISDSGYTTQLDCRREELK